MREPLLVTMNGKDSVNIQSLSNFEAGILFLGALNQVYPKIKLSEMISLANPNPVIMGRSWLERQISHVGSAAKIVGNAIVSTTGNIKDGIGDVLKDSATGIGDIGGSTIRLLADPEVSDLALKAGAAYATGGGSVGVQDVIDRLTGGKNADGTSNSTAAGIMDWISNLGYTTKAKAATTSAKSMPGWIVPAGIGTAVVLVVLLMSKK